jgi:hypothetical protein
VVQGGVEGLSDPHASDRGREKGAMVEYASPKEKRLLVNMPRPFGLAGMSGGGGGLWGGRWVGMGRVGLAGLDLGENSNGS